MFFACTLSMHIIVAVKVHLALDWNMRGLDLHTHTSRPLWGHQCLLALIIFLAVGGSGDHMHHCFHLLAPL